MTTQKPDGLNKPSKPSQSNELARIKVQISALLKQSEVLLRSSEISQDDLGLVNGI
jgi:hypothetical protein